MFKRIVLNRLVLLLIITMGISCSIINKKIKPLTSPNAIAYKNNIERLTESFFDLLDEKKLPYPYKPDIIIVNKVDSRFIPYKNKGKLITPYWEELDKSTQDFFNKSVKNSEYNGRIFFETYFNWFLPIHELGHFIQFINNDTLGHYKKEINANEIAITYYREIGDTIKLNKLLNYIKNTRLKMIAPKDTSEEYFNNNYYNILNSNSEEYGYFQFMFVEHALKTKKKSVSEFYKNTNQPTY